MSQTSGDDTSSPNIMDRDDHNSSQKFKMPIRPLSDELLKVAKEELNEEPRRISEDIAHIQDWLKKQPHLNIRPDEQLLASFLRGCKWSLQRAKEKIDFFYSMRNLLPEIYDNRDPFPPDIQRVLDAGIMFPLPTSKETNGYRICFFNCSNIKSEDITLNSIMKIFFITLDILLNEDDNFSVAGVALLVDYKNVPFNLVVQFTPTIAKKFIIMWERAYPIRIRECVGINTPSIIDGLYNNVCKIFFSEKLKNRITFCTSSNTELAYQKIDKSLFPKEYGGENDSIEELAKQWKEKVESYRNWLLEDNKYCCNEKLRIGNKKSLAEELGMEGSFRKLMID